MGQYWKLVNLDKMEFVHPHKLGNGLKLLEMAWPGAPGIGTAMILLMANRGGEKRGGGDPRHGALVLGHWAGDRVMLVGDYAEDSDGPPINGIERSWMYKLCIPEGGLAERIESLREWADRHPTLSNQRLITYLERGGAIFRDTSDDIAAAIEQEFDGKYVGDGWRDWEEGAR